MSRSLGLVAADAASDGEPLLGAASQSLRVANAGDGMDLAAAEAVAAGFLRALGIGLDSPHLRATPMRMGRAWAEMLTPRPFVMTTFPNEEGYDQLVLARDIAFRSVCEHHLLPFTGRACVAYLPGPRSSACPSSPGWWSTSPAAHRPRSGSPAGRRLPAGPAGPACGWRGDGR